jgi:hypothetical protein
MVWSEANHGTVDFVAAGIFKMSRPKVGVVSEVDVGACGEAGAGVFGEGVQC